MFVTWNKISDYKYLGPYIFGHRYNFYIFVILAADQNIFKLQFYNEMSFFFLFVVVFQQHFSC